VLLRQRRLLTPRGVVAPRGGRKTPCGSCCLRAPAGLWSQRWRRPRTRRSPSCCRTRSRSRDRPGPAPRRPDLRRCPRPRLSRVASCTRAGPSHRFPVARCPSSSTTTTAGSLVAFLTCTSQTTRWRAASRFGCSRASSSTTVKARRVASRLRIWAEVATAPRSSSPSLRISYAAGSYGTGHDVDLRKGAICIAAN
jgi:hypothetical protein